MANTHERIKKRREYVKRKVVAYTLMTLSILVAIPCALLAVVLFLLAIVGILDGIFWEGIFWPALKLGDLALRFSESAQKAHGEARQLPYVPPVTPDSLPAEEVLLRGSQEPLQEQGKTLLRAADGSSADTPEQELLRASQQ